MKQIAGSWHDGYASMIADLAPFLPPLRRPRRPRIGSSGLVGSLSIPRRR